MSRKLINVALDLETLSLAEDAAIIQIGCCIPEFDRPYISTEHEFEATIAYEKCLSSEFNIDNQTMNWWEKQPTKTQVFSGQDSYVDALSALSDWFNKLRADGSDIALWGNGSDFDNRILAYTANSLGFNNLWSYKNNRCFRTLKALFAVPPQLVGEMKGEVKHTALGDARWEARMMLCMYNCHPELRKVL